MLMFYLNLSLTWALCEFTVDIILLSCYNALFVRDANLKKVKI